MKYAAYNQNALKHAVMLVLALLGVFWGVESLGVNALTQLPPLDDTTLLGSGWEYRVGDSPQKAGSAPDWTVQEKSLAWVRGGNPSAIPLQKGLVAMWMRVKLPSGNWAAPSLFIENSSAHFQVYMSGKLLYPSDFQGSASRHARNVSRWHVIPLPDAIADQYVYLRVLRPNASEPVGRVSLGSRHLHYKTIVNGSLWKIAIGLLTFLVGVAAFSASAFRKFQPMTLAFSSLAGAAGTYMFLSAPLRLEWLNAPFFWSFFEYGALFLTPPAFYWFLREFMDSKHTGILKIASKSHVALALVLQLAALSSYFSYKSILIAFFVASSVTIAYVSKSIFNGYRNVQAELKAPMLAVGLMLGCALWDMLSWSFSEREISPWPGAFVVSLTLAVCMVAFAILRAGIAQERNLERVNGLLERSVGAAVEMSASNQIMQALSKTAEAMVRDLQVESICNVHVYLKNHERSPESSLFEQAMLVTQGRLVSNPSMGPLRQKFEGIAEQLMSSDEAYVNAKKMLVIPVFVDSKKWGFLTIDNYKHARIHSDDEILMRVLCATLGHTLLALDLRDHALTELKLESELQITSALQRFLIPDSLQIPNAQVASSYRAAATTGGDWFGYNVHSNKKRVDIVMGDATSHGLKSALMVAHASGAVQAAISRFMESESISDEDRLTRLARGVNKVIFEAGRDELYMAMLFVSVELETGMVHYLSAGHPPFYCIDAQTGRAQSVVPAPSQALGFTKAPIFKIGTIELKKGDVLFFSSSGLFDNEGEGGRRLSSRRLKTLLEKSKDPSEIQEYVLSAAETVWKKAELRDDVTTIVFKWLGSVRATQEIPVSVVSKHAV